jgi:uncharacterized protein (DUF2267 family)
VERECLVTVPAQYVQASEDFMRFLVDVRDVAGLTTTNQAYTVAEGVLLTFRRRLDAAGVARFAGVLPPVLRAIFVAGWDPTQPQRAFDDHAVMTEEVRSLRPLHNYASETSIHDVAVALRRNVDEVSFDDALALLSPGAVRFWHA